MFWDDEVFEKEAQKQRERSQWRAEQKSKSSHTSSSSSRNSGSSHSSSKNPGTKGNRPYAKAKYRLHPDPDFDPNEYLLADEIQNHRPPSKFRDALRRHRWGLYRIFVETVRKSSKVKDHMEDRLDFLQFVKRTTMDLEISYSLWAGLLHSYLVYQSFSRISYCPSPMELHNVPAIPKFFATLAPTWVCTTRPRTFVDLVSWIQFFFYSGTLGSRLIDASGLEKSMYIHGPYIVSGGLWSAFWFLPTLNGLRTWTLDGSLSPLTPGFEATRTALWTPLLQWCLFLFSRRVYLSLMTWEYETAMNEADIRDENEAKLMYGHGQLVPDFRSKCFQVWIHVLPVMSLCLWEWVLKPRDSTPTDLDVWPGFLWTLLVTLFATWTHRIFLSFQRFSYGCLVWTEPLESGVVLTVLGRTVHYGLIY